MKFSDYSFYIHFISIDKPDLYHRILFNTTAPHYEAAVAQALAVGQQYLRDHDEHKDLFMRVTGV